MCVYVCMGDNVPPTAAAGAGAAGGVSANSRNTDTMRTALLLTAATSALAGPCDILGAAGNPCVAAHSTVRALYAAYAGPLYNVTRPNGATANISVLSPGGFANAAAHDAFCAAGDCVITLLYDQSPNANHLGQRHKLVNASRHPITVSGGKHVYGMWFDPGYGYVRLSRGTPAPSPPAPASPPPHRATTPLPLASRLRAPPARGQDDGHCQGQ